MTAMVLLGPPGVGKGTQALRIGGLLSIPTISTGQIFRANIAEKTELGIVAQQFIDKGEFVPDSVTNPMVSARLSAPDVRAGFLLDGYPRTLDQAHALRDTLAERSLSLDVVIEITAPRDVLISHMQKRAKEENRSDDTIEVFEHRLTAYRDRTEPIATYYADQDMLELVDGVGSIEEVTQRVSDVLKARGFLS